MVWVCLLFAVNLSPLSLAIFTKWSEFSLVEDTLIGIERNNIRIVLYIVDDRVPLQAGDNCIYHDSVTRWMAIDE